MTILIININQSKCWVKKVFVFEHDLINVSNIKYAFKIEDSGMRDGIQGDDRGAYQNRFCDAPGQYDVTV